MVEEEEGLMIMGFDKFCALEQLRTGLVWGSRANFIFLVGYSACARSSLDVNRQAELRV